MTKFRFFYSILLIIPKIFKIFRLFNAFKTKKLTKETKQTKPNTLKKMFDFDENQTGNPFRAIMVAALTILLQYAVYNSTWKG